MASPIDHSPEPSPIHSRLFAEPEDDDDLHSEPRFSDGDTASARSITLSSPPRSPRESISLGVPQPQEPALTPVTMARQSLSLANLAKRNTLDTESSPSSDMDADGDDRSFFARKYDEGESPLSSVPPSVHEVDKSMATPLPPSLPPSATLSSSRSSAASATGTFPHLDHLKSDTDSIASFGSASTSYSKKARPESLVVQSTKGPLVLGIALVDFNHLVGPKIDFSRGDIFDDEEIAKILPFLALPDGAHLTTEDYSYFHLVPSVPNPSTIFGISCNRQISAADLLVKGPDVTRSTVQKAVVVLASKPVFGPVRDRLGVITRTLFSQRDFTDVSILDDFYSSLEVSLRGQMTESGLYMGTSLKELVHNFRQRTLTLVKALMLQRKVMFYGHPVERLCTYQYSLVTLVPGLFHSLEDCGSPPLATRAATLQKPNSLKTSDPKSMMAYMGLPLDLFGRDSFFQPYLPLQQLDLLKDTPSWLCGSTNSIVTQQKDIDLLVNIETGAIEFRTPSVERMVALTAADRKWMDDIVTDVNNQYTTDSEMTGMHFKGSDDYIRQKFEEYLMAALSTVKYATFLGKGQNSGVMIADGGDSNAVADFNPVWLQEFRKTQSHEVWERVTDSMLFDIIEARHPCGEKPTVVSDIGLRLSEGIQELKLDQQLAPTREAISRTLAAGSTNFFNAVAGVRERWGQRQPSTDSVPTTSSYPASQLMPMRVDTNHSHAAHLEPKSPGGTYSTPNTPTTHKGLRPLSIVGAQSLQQPEPPKTTLGGWGANIGSFFSARTSSRMSVSSTTSNNGGSNSRPSSIASLSRSASPMPPVPPVPPLPAGVEKSVPHIPKDVQPVPKDVPPVSPLPKDPVPAEMPMNLDDAHTGSVLEPVNHRDDDANSTASSLSGTMAM
ncbi:transport protein Avl9-domain-containing protein [Epithele typhae]|uniref:transport protein Avl9-domain-containing protein n=1 Tax=Epithele typhae TaxID=378194 RepID=UPI002007D366|nr:transport protein Avl9-domain-containing protein [Epithele typhae]KAH9924315.1 transport protein Avl9-domain-containing protein [Epithele typhae]